MKQLTIDSLELTNFQKFDYRKVLFGRNTDISGENGSGKTTIYSGVTWLLFGKDSQGREKFDIKHLVDGVKQDRVDVSVQGEFTLSIDGRKERITLKRVLVEKWDEKTDTYKGDETRCYINGVPKLVTEYNDFVYDIIAEEDFRIITSVTHFLSMKQDEQRAYLCKMAGVREVGDIVRGVTEWENAIREMPSKMTIEDYVKTVKESLKRYKDDKKGIQPSINALIQSMPQEQNWAEIENEQARIKEEIALIDSQLSTSSADVELLKSHKQQKMAEIERLEKEKSEAKKKCYADIAELKTRAKLQAEAQNTEYDNTEKRLLEMKVAIRKAEASLSSARADEKRLDLELTELYNQYMEESKKVYVESNCLMCPLADTNECKTEAVLSIHKTEQNRLREEFNRNKVAKLQVIMEQGKAKKTELENTRSACRQYSAEVEELGIKIQATENRFAAMVKVQVPSTEEAEAEITAKCQAVIAEIDERIDGLWDSAKVIHPDDTAQQFVAKREQLLKRNEELIKTLSDREQISRMKEKVEEITNHGKEVSTMITKYENLLDVLAQIRRAVVEDATQRINEKFQITKWVTSVQQKNGDWKDCCIPTIDGVSISLNTASRINVGLDICNAISRYLNISVPCFIDNRESVNEIVNLGVTQVINLRVAPKGTPLTINQ